MSFISLSWFEKNEVTDGLIVPHPEDPYTLTLCGHGVTQQTALDKLDLIRRSFPKYTLQTIETTESSYIVPMSKSVNIEAASPSTGRGTANIFFKGQFNDEQKYFALTAGHVMFSREEDHQQCEHYQHATHLMEKLKDTEWCLKGVNTLQEPIKFTSSPVISYKYYTKEFLQDSALLPVVSKSSEAFHNFLHSLPSSAKSYKEIFEITPDHIPKLGKLDGVKVLVGETQGVIIPSPYPPNSAVRSYGIHLSFNILDGRYQAISICQFLLEPLLNFHFIALVFIAVVLQS